MRIKSEFSCFLLYRVILYFVVLNVIICCIILHHIILLYQIKSYDYRRILHAFLHLLPHTAHLEYFHFSRRSHILDFISILLNFYFIYPARFIGSVFALTTDSVLRMLNIGRDDTKRLPLKVITAVFLLSSYFPSLTHSP